MFLSGILGQSERKKFEFVSLISFSFLSFIESTLFHSLQCLPSLSVCLSVSVLHYRFSFSDLFLFRFLTITYFSELFFNVFFDPIIEYSLFFTKSFLFTLIHASLFAFIDISVFLYSFCSPSQDLSNTYIHTYIWRNGRFL